MAVSPAGGSGWPVRECGPGRPRAQRASVGRLALVYDAKCPTVGRLTATMAAKRPTVAARAGRPRRAAVRAGPDAANSPLPLDASLTRQPATQPSLEGSDPAAARTPG